MAITDLTGTTWEVASGWQATAGYGMFTLNGSYTVDNYEYKLNGSSFLLGYKVDDMVPIAEANTFTTAEHLRNVTNSKSFTLTITDSTTYPDLISWLETYGVCTSGGEPEEPTEYIEVTYADKVFKLTAGQKITFKGGKVMQSDIVAKVVEAETLISFTIDGTTYYSPEGWTWAEWVADTEYNTIGFYTLGSNIVYRPYTNNDVYTTPGYLKNVRADGEIINGTAYTTLTGGGAD